MEYLEPHGHTRVREVEVAQNSILPAKFDENVHRRTAYAVRRLGRQNSIFSSHRHCGALSVQSRQYLNLEANLGLSSLRQNEQQI